MYIGSTGCPYILFKWFNTGCRNYFYTNVKLIPPIFPKKGDTKTFNITKHLTEDNQTKKRMIYLFNVS